MEETKKELISILLKLKKIEGSKQDSRKVCYIDEKTIASEMLILLGKLKKISKE